MKKLDQLNLFLKESVTINDFLLVVKNIFNSKTTNSTLVPTLSNNAFLRYASFVSLYFAQGIPGGLLFYAMPAWLAMIGVSAVDIGKYIAVATLPWSFKIVAAPLMDRFTFLPMGRRRPWILFGQMGIVLGLVLMSFVKNPSDNLNVLMVYAFAISLFSIFQDIGVDGLAIDVLPVHQQARANGLMWGGKIVGISTTVGVTSLLFNSIGFTKTLQIFSLIVLLIFIIPLLVKERPVEKKLPWTKGAVSKEVAQLHLPSWKLIVQRLFKAFFLPTSLIMGIAAFSISIGKGFIDAILPVFTVQELGWTDTTYSSIFATTAMVSGLLGMFIGGALVDIFGKIRMLSIYLVALIILQVLMATLSKYWPNELFISTFFFVFYAFETFIAIAIFAIAMQLCWKQVAATQFTLYMALSNLGLSAGAWLMGTLSTHFNWNFMFLTYIAFALFTLIAIQFTKFDKHAKLLKNKMTK